MANTRVKKIKYTRFHEGQELRAELLVPEDMQKILSPFDSEYEKYLLQLNAPRVLDPQKPFTRLETILFPGEPSLISVQITQTLYQDICALAEQALHFRAGGFLGYGADQDQYNSLSSTLKQVGEYFESRIKTTPWHVPVAEEYYLMATLKVSPQAFLHAQQDQAARVYIQELNQAKRCFPKQALTTGLSNLPAQLQAYTQNIKTANDKPISTITDYHKQIKKIEKQRSKRWSITNFFRDVFLGEASELETLKVKLEAGRFIQASPAAIQTIDPLLAIIAATNEVIRQELKDITDCEKGLTCIARWERLDKKVYDYLDVNLLKEIEQKKIEWRDELAKSIASHLDEIAIGDISPERKLILKSRFQHVALISNWNSLCEVVIKTIRKQARSDLSIQAIKNYWQDIKDILPVALQTEQAFSELVREAKFAVVKKHFSSSQKKLHEKYQDELEILRTGNLDGWTSIFSDKNPRELTEDNLQKWRHDFLNSYTRELIIDQDVKMMIDEMPAADAAVILEYLKQEISADYREISNYLTQDLSQLTRLRQKKQADAGKKWLASFDGVDRFMSAYLVLTSYQRQFANNRMDKDGILVDTGRPFVRQFHDAAQHSSGFVTGVVAKLPLPALEAMYLSWVSNPQIKFSNQADAAPLHLVDDIIGHVDAGNDQSIQVPQYLFVRMVMELVIADFDAVIHGKEVDKKLMEARLAFLIPKLAEQAKAEENLNNNSSDLRTGLEAALKALHPTADTFKERYTQLVKSHMPALGIAPDWDAKFGVLKNKKEFEVALLKCVKAEILKLMEIFAGIKPEDIVCNFSEVDVQVLDNEIKKLAATKAGERVISEIEKLDIAIQKVKSRREVINTMIENTAVKKACFDGFKDYFVDEAGVKLKKLIYRTTSLNELMDALNADIFSLFDNEKLREICAVVKQHLSLSTLISDAPGSAYMNLLENVGNKDLKIVDVVRDFPEDVRRELPTPVADMVGQLQYRFADYFKKVMVQMLSQENIASIEAKMIAENAKKKVEAEPAPSTIGSMMTLFRPAEKKTAPVVSVEPIAEVRLKAALNGMKPSLKSQVLALSSQNGEGSLHEMMGVTAPVRVKGR